MKYLIDLDGTIVHEKKANRDSVVFVAELYRRELPFLIMTNSVKSPQFIKEQLQSIGISVGKKNIINPITAINRYLKKEGLDNVFIVGGELVAQQVDATQNITNPDIVILLDFENENYSYKDLQTIFSLIQKGVPVISASGSTYYLRNEIKYLDTGAFVKLFEHSGDIGVKIMGKPSIDYFNAGISILEAEPNSVTVIGDDWSTDINGAINAGCEAILIRSGKYQRGDENKCKAKKVITNLMEVFE